jgi:hypothetical protein
MKTLTEIVNAENAIRERARAYEVALSDVTERRLQVERLSVEPDAETIKRLRRICDDANALPANVIGSCGGLIPIAGEVRVFVHALAASALNNLVGRDQRRQQDLASARAALERAETTFAEFKQ